MKGEYLHKIDVVKLSKETNLSLDEIAKLSGIKEARNLGKWNQDKPDGARPNYNAIIRLLKNGASTETLFGVECKSSLPMPEIREDAKISIRIIELLNHPEFVSGMEKALADVEARKNKTKDQ